jgi:EAL domain-containing protein (putative c-di-GMP-specific phosphodiesterase class I)
MYPSWYLEGASAGNSVLIAIDHLPFQIGRESSCDLTVVARDMSRHHALLDRFDDTSLQLTDLGSTNGTFVNRERLTKNSSIQLKDGDILHFGTNEFRLKSRPDAQQALGTQGYDMTHTMVFSTNAVLPERFSTQEREFLELLDQQLVTVALQPIVSFEGRKTVAYEVLGRGKHPDLGPSPVRLFELAALLDKEVALSQAFRLAAAGAAASMPGQVKLFMNTHPREMFTEDLYSSLQTLQSVAPNMTVVLEVHETAVAEVNNMKHMAQRLKDMGIEIAFDDFGAGQSRLNEMAEVPPQVVKFDMSLIRDIDQASPKKQQMLAQLVTMVHSMGSISLAEGVETEAEAACCQAMGFQLCQGYLTGKPVLI